MMIQVSVKIVEMIPKPKRELFRDLSYENFQLLYINQILIPLSTHYSTNFRKILIKDHFNISYDEESHILYLLIEYAIRNPNENIIPYFEKILNETKKKKILKILKMLL